MTAPVPGAAGPLSELVTFVQHALPGFEAGRYELNVTQQVLDSTGAAIGGDGLSRSYSFAVRGDRFRLANPADSLYAVFPDDGATGEFSTVLPHAVFSAPTLPWARTPFTAPPPPTPPGADTDNDVPTWLGILVLDDADEAAFPGLSVKAADATVGDLLPPALHPTSSLGDSLSYFYQAADTSGLEPGDDPDLAVKVIDLPLALFWQVAPSIADLTLLAHVRQVSLLNKPTIARISDQGEPVGDFAIVVANRLPADGRTSTAHLVCLEGMEQLLPTDDGQLPPGNRYPDTTTIRLAVLKSWSFTAIGQSATFVNALLALNQGRHDAASTTLSYPAHSDSPAVAAALGNGYVALDHNLRDRGATVSWYRGPLTPAPVSGDRIELPISSADQALFFDPTSGTFDVSYAAAWTLGRMLALQDPAFAASLYRWKQGLTRQVVDAVEAEVLQAAFTAPSSPAAALAPPARPPVDAVARLVPQLLRAFASPGEP
jgi:hypothetical protein